MKMRLAPLFNSGGLLLGHINLALCIKGHNCYTADESAGRIGPYTTQSLSDTVRIFRFYIKRLRFRWGADDETTVRYLICDEEIPDWVWKMTGIKFSDTAWERD